MKGHFRMSASTVVETFSSSNKCEQTLIKERSPDTSTVGNLEVLLEKVRD